MNIGNHVIKYMLSCVWVAFEVPPCRRAGGQVGRRRGLMGGPWPRPPPSTLPPGEKIFINFTKDFPARWITISYHCPKISWGITCNLAFKIFFLTEFLQSQQSVTVDRTHFNSQLPSEASWTVSLVVWEPGSECCPQLPRTSLIYCNLREMALLPQGSSFSTWPYVVCVLGGGVDMGFASWWGRRVVGELYLR